MNCFNICSVTSKSAITPSFIGRIASMLPGTLPSICLASVPTAADQSASNWPAFLRDGDYRWLVEHDALAAHVDQGVGGAEVDRKVVRKIAAQEPNIVRASW